jgi:hypothetical protein
MSQGLKQSEKVSLSGTLRTSWSQSEASRSRWSQSETSRSRWSQSETSRSRWSQSETSRSRWSQWNFMFPLVSAKLHIPVGLRVKFHVPVGLRVKLTCAAYSQVKTSRFPFHWRPTFLLTRTRTRPRDIFIFNICYLFDAQKTLYRVVFYGLSTCVWKCIKYISRIALRRITFLLDVHVQQGAYAPCLGFLKNSKY